MQIKETVDSAGTHGSSSCAGHDDPSALFRAWCLGHSGCEGGDLGCPCAPATWVCGIEPGGPHSVDAAALQRLVRAPGAAGAQPGYADWHSNLAGSFRRRITKLLAALHGWPVAEYRTFAEQRQPFVQGRRGYARLNLYPVGFADTDPSRWNADFAAATGFTRKADYLAWCDAHRLPTLRRRAAAHVPRLVVGLGKSYLAPFQRAFLDPDASLAHESVAGKPLSWGRNAEGSVVAVLPFLTSASGLQSNAAIQDFGRRLREICAAQNNQGQSKG